MQLDRLFIMAILAQGGGCIGRGVILETKKNEKILLENTRGIATAGRGKLGMVSFSWYLGGKPQNSVIGEDGRCTTGRKDDPRFLTCTAFE